MRLKLSEQLRSKVVVLLCVRVGGPGNFLLNAVLGAIVARLLGDRLGKLLRDLLCGVLCEQLCGESWGSNYPKVLKNDPNMQFSTFLDR